MSAPSPLIVGPQTDQTLTTSLLDFVWNKPSTGYKQLLTVTAAPKATSLTISNPSFRTMPTKTR